MRTIAVLLAFLSLNAGAASNLCESSEAVVFSCEVGRSHKVVSLCASRALSSDHGSLAYRFGGPGHIELEFPARGTPFSAKQFRYAHYLRYQVDRTEVTFNVGAYSYTVFSYYDAEAKPPMSEGVRVSQGQSKSSLGCTSKAAADFAALEAAVPCDSENALAMCR